MYPEDASRKAFDDYLNGIIDRRRKSIEMAIKIAENETNDKKEEKA